jgi:hypothetical protein
LAPTMAPTEIARKSSTMRWPPEDDLPKKNS